MTCGDGTKEAAPLLLDHCRRRSRRPFRTKRPFMRCCDRRRRHRSLEHPHRALVPDTNLHEADAVGIEAATAGIMRVTREGETNFITRRRTSGTTDPHSTIEGITKAVRRQGRGDRRRLPVATTIMPTRTAATILGETRTRTRPTRSSPISGCPAPCPRTSRRGTCTRGCCSSSGSRPRRGRPTPCGACTSTRGMTCSRRST
jgi:hypothetical protein